MSDKCVVNFAGWIVPCKDEKQMFVDEVDHCSSSYGSN
jgi:hypothetical protein